MREQDYRDRLYLEEQQEDGVTRVFDSDENTAGNPEKYYSYRMEKGRTGRMLALLALKQ